MSASNGYQHGGASAGAGGGAPIDQSTQYKDLGALKRCYHDYIWSKRDEINEQIDSRRYYHGAQWTDDQIKTLKKRRQPVMTYNRIARKIDGVVGLIERLKQDPKAYARTPKHEQGAELATAVLRYVLDAQNWDAKAPEVARDGAVDGVGGLELNLTQGDHGDIDVELEIVEPDSFFYDPRSFRNDFSDARYMGVAKWVDVDTAKEMFPDKVAEIEASIETDTDLTTDSDRETKWYSNDGQRNMIRLVDHWYKHMGRWCYSLHTGSAILMEGQSYLVDEKGEAICKFIMFSANVDHDGDRYGFIRNMRSAQDGINAKQSKMQHILGSRRLIMTHGSVQDVETARKEWARPDGVVVVNPGGEVKPDDQSFDFGGWSKMLELNLAEIENFGPNPALIGQGVENKSGRAIALLQQAGVAELGPYILAYRGWKLRLYRAVWNAVQRHWTGERWIRVTDDDQVAQFIQVNGIGVDPRTGMPTVVNALGSLDIDIIIDEGPDTLTMAQDNYDALLALAQRGANVPPRVLIELAPLNYTTKKKITDLMDQAAQQPNPEVAAKQAELQLKQADAQAQMQLKAAQAQQDAQLKRDELAANIELKRSEAAADIQLEREKAAAQLMLQREKQEAMADLKQQEAAARVEIDRDRAGQEAAL